MPREMRCPGWSGTEFATGDDDASHWALTGDERAKQGEGVTRRGGGGGVKGGEAQEVGGRGDGESLLPGRRGDPRRGCRARRLARSCRPPRRRRLRLCRLRFRRLRRPPQGAMRGCRVDNGKERRAVGRCSTHGQDNDDKGRRRRALRGLWLF
jgi:hypothetical protein